MSLKRLFLCVLPLSILLTGCLEPTGPQLPDDEENTEEPKQNELVVTAPGR